MNDVEGVELEREKSREKKNWKDRERCWPSRKKCKSLRDCERNRLSFRLRFQEHKGKYGRCIKWVGEEGGKVQMERRAADRA